MRSRTAAAKLDGTSLTAPSSKTVQFPADPRRNCDFSLHSCLRLSSVTVPSWPLFRLISPARRQLHLLAKGCSPGAAESLIATLLPDPLSSLRLPRYFTQPQLTAFFAVIEDARDRVLFALAYLYGLRVGELALLRQEDVDLVRGRILIRRLKRGLWGEQPLFVSMAILLRGYMQLPSSRPEEPLFPGRKGPLRKRQVQSRFVLYRDRAHLPTYLTCHSLRHAIATHLLDAGVSLEFVQDHLGHQSIRSTSIYARITDRHRAAVFERLDHSPWIVQPDLGRTGASENGPDEDRY